MKIDSLLYKSPDHPNFNEDALIHDQVGDSWFVAAVMDGCSSGRESHFISGLLVKLIRKSIRTLPYLEKVNPGYALSGLTPEVVGEIILNQVFDESKKLVKSLLLEYDEALATLILMVYQINSRELYINVSGDGFFEVNQQVRGVDQDNRPDFMGYHYDKTGSVWLKNHTQSHTFSGVTSAGIATDGIAKFTDRKRQEPETETADFFLTNQKEAITLARKFGHLTRERSLFPQDDMAVVIFINE